MKNLSQLAGELIDQEGYREQAYKDSVGFWTIGVGHFLGNSSSWEGQKWSPKRIITTFLLDIQEAEEVARTLYKEFDTLSDSRQRAVVNLAFNMGYNTLAKFKNSNQLFNDRKYAEAANAFMQSKWASQVGPRAKYVTELIRNG